MRTQVWRKLRREGGKVRLSIVTVLIVLALAAAVYAAVVFIPVYMEHYKFEEKLHAVANMAHRTKDVDKLRHEIERETKLLGLNLPYDAVQIEFDPRGEWMEIRARYNRVVELAPFGTETTLHFESDIIERF